MDPRSWNRYSYTRNVLTNRIDPLGLDDEDTDAEPIECTNCVVNISPGPDPIIPLGAAGLAAFGIGGVLNRPRWNLDGHSTGPGGQSDEERLGAGIKAAQDALKNPSKECLALFGGKTENEVRDLLGQIMKDGLLRFGSNYQSYDRQSDSNITKQFPTYSDGSIAAGITSSLKLPNGSIGNLITFRTGGGFFTLMITNVSPSGVVSQLPLSSFVGFGGLSPAKLRGVMILHELRHAAGVSSDDHTDSRKNLEFTKEVATKCFKGK